MHETSICQRVVEQLKQIAQAQSATAVTQVKIQLGPFSGITAEGFQHAFPFATTDTIASDAELIIETLPLRILCRQCNTEQETSPQQLVCPACDSTDIQLLNGDEIQIHSIEIKS